MALKLHKESPGKFPGNSHLKLEKRKPSIGPDGLKFDKMRIGEMLGKVLGFISRHHNQLPEGYNWYYLQGSILKQLREEHLSDSSTIPWLSVSVSHKAWAGMLASGLVQTIPILKWPHLAKKPGKTIWIFAAAKTTGSTDK